MSTTDVTPEQWLAAALDPVVFWHLVSPGTTPDEWQARLLRSTHPRCLVNCSRQSGKGEAVAHLAAHTALFKPGSLTVAISPSLRQSNELFDRVVDKTKSAMRLGRGKVPLRLEKETATEMRVPGGGRVISLPGGSDATIRGFSAPNLVLIDEAARVSDEVVTALLPMLATVEQGRLVLLSTPWGKDNFFAEAWFSGGDWERYRVTADQCPRIPPSFLETQRSTMLDWCFHQEFYCMFAATEAAAFPPHLLERCKAHKVVPLTLSGAAGLWGNR